jgi:hypothetical protein
MFIGVGLLEMIGIAAIDVAGEVQMLKNSLV